MKNSKFPPNTKIIKVQSKLHPLFVWILTLFAIVLIFVLLYLLRDSSSGSYKIYDIFALILFFVPVWIKNAQEKEEFVSDMIISEGMLTLVYKRGQKITRYRSIPLDNIVDFKVDLNANYARVGRSVALFCKTKVKIDTGKEVISFKEVPTGSFNLCSYAFFLRLLQNAKYIPYLNWKVHGNALDVKEDANYMEMYGKRLPLYKRLYLFNKSLYEKSGIIGRFINFFIIICFLIFFLFVGMEFFLLIPVPLNTQEKAFMEHYDKAYQLRQANKCNDALYELSKAENIINEDTALHREKAYCYEHLKNYSLALEEAEEGLKYIKPKAIYESVSDKANNFKFSGYNEPALRTIIAENLYHLKRYDKAIKAFTIILENKSYKHTDAYLWRGASYYYLGDINSALKDFTQYKTIVETFIAEHPDWNYYDAKNLDNANQWINKCISYKKQK